MDINATLIGSTLSFLIFVYFCYKFVWPPINDAIEKRQKEIADSLNAANAARESIATEKNKAELEIEKAKVRAKEIISQAEKQASSIVEKAINDASEQGKKLIENANQEISRERSRVQQELRAEVATIAIQIAEKIVQRELTSEVNQDIIDNALSKL